MNVSPAVVRALCKQFSYAEIEAKLKVALEALETGSVITQVTSGQGTGYQRQIVMRPDEAVELYQAALDYKDDTDTAADFTQVESFIVCKPVG